MTDALYPVTTIASHESPHASVPNAFAFNQNQRYSLPVLDGTQDDDGQISCFCGYADDDGNTVACDQCDRWNHTICYYPQYEGRELPKDLQHYCVECRPRPVDTHAARVRQRHRREQQDIAANGSRRPASKSHKKKVKEPGNGGYTNGWPLDKSRHDRNSASPRDLPPPAKRPKTSHRTSDSSTPAAKGHARKRTVTNANHRRSLSRSPETPIDYYSREFLDQCANDSWSLTDTNLHADIRVTNTLTAWIHQDPEEFAKQHTGHSKHQILLRWDGELDEIPGKADYAIEEQRDPSEYDTDGQGLVWKRVVIRGEPVADGAYIGELRGHVGLKDDYTDDPAKRWSQLRHPVPFVFFHPMLPIYIDARHEGTELRYVRRSCNPNATLQILVTGGTNYRFCFMASRQMEPGEEVSIAWNTEEMNKVAANSTGPNGMDIDMLSVWVSTVLSNCGPCACGLAEHECRMSRFDRRTRTDEREGESRPVKLPKSKKKKAGQHVSPLNTHALNSRSGSEARRADADDEPTDSRSASGSGGRDSTSRDITPNTHYSTNGSLSAVPEMSERERKKLAKEEEMFRRQEEERNGKQAKKKRGSAGSALTTPSATSSKQLSLPSSSRYTDAGTSRQAGLPSARSVSGKRPRAQTTQKPPVKSYVKVVKRARPDYVNAEVQCDMDEVEAREQPTSPRPLQKCISVRQRLLERCARNNAINHASLGKPKSAGSPSGATAMDLDHTVSEKPSSPTSPDSGRPSPTDKDPKVETSDDVQMQDAPPVDATSRPPLPSSDCTSVSTQAVTSAPGLLTTDGPATLPSSKPPEMHLQMPPPPKEFSASSAIVTGDTPKALGGPVVQSPASLTGASLLPPSVNSAVTPARKKLSLSDYTRRSKAKDKEHE
ncbi:hypothetical protein EJ03DRAFT_346892 [Teratosphaeria nubilosa]|uniref:PHD-type domain-containing protein n=1 Tax=Teratosphaeria nubilosa TaxID=161662 RepID=A0A6G1LP38_9PEZI|nr:hypothetical protein EJ03DRAFT_346892 [Teratosphaeria nubilosa]